MMIRCARMWAGQRGGRRWRDLRRWDFSTRSLGEPPLLSSSDLKSWFGIAMIKIAPVLFIWYLEWEKDPNFQVGCWDGEGVAGGWSEPNILNLVAHFSYFWDKYTFSPWFSLLAGVVRMWNKNCFGNVFVTFLIARERFSLKSRVVPSDFWACNYIRRIWLLSATLPHFTPKRFEETRQQ